MREWYSLCRGDCMDILSSVPDSSVDMVMCDLPYGTTYAKWDNILPMEHLWRQYRRVCKPTAPILLFGVQPFSSMLVSSAPNMFRFEWVWNKEHASNFANANRQPLKQHEYILVFSVSPGPIYFPQKVMGARNHGQGSSSKLNKSETRLISKRVEDDESGMKFPKSILHFPKHSSQCGLHPTQKPVDLCEYLIRSHSSEGGVVLDNCMGSGTTGVACANTDRRFIGIEKDDTYFDIAKDRVETAYL